MITKSTAVLVALLLSSASFAAAPLAEVYPTPEIAPAAAKTRAQVISETIQAQATSRPQLAEAGYDYAGSYNREAQQGGKTRAEVVAELRQSLSDGTYVTAESEYFPTGTLAGTPRSRSEVRADAIQSAQSGNGVAVQTRRK